MGTMTFHLPGDLPGHVRDELERASIAGGQDHMPFPTQVEFGPGQISLHRQVDESGCLLTPWHVNGAGQVLVRSATLMERMTPYYLAVELARGKINQLRCQASDWIMGGLEMPPAVAQKIHEATQAFGRTIALLPAPAANQEAQDALSQGFTAAEELVRTYVQQVFDIRHSRQPRLESLWGCRVNGPLDVPENRAALARAFNTIVVPFSWREIEPVAGQYHWDKVEALVNWARGQNLVLAGGPLVDFSGEDLPDWIWEKAVDVAGLSATLCGFVETLVKRFRDRVSIWQVTAASNFPGVLASADEDLLWLTLRLVDTVKQVDPNLEVVIGLAQPGGDYLAEQHRNLSPFLFADTLLRTGVKLAALDLEMIMGVWPRGSYCRDVLEVSRLLDLYAFLGVPIQVTLGYPSLDASDPLANPDLRLTVGRWRDAFTPQVQADWAEAFGSLCLAKPYVRAVHWCHGADQHAHLFPHCGLIDAQGKTKPALERLAKLRADHLK